MPYTKPRFSVEDHEEFAPVLRESFDNLQKFACKMKESYRTSDPKVCYLFTVLNKLNKIRNELDCEYHNLITDEYWVATGEKHPYYSK